MKDTIKISDDFNGNEKRAILSRIDSNIRKRVTKPTDHELFLSDLRRESDDIVSEHNLAANDFLQVGADIAKTKNGEPVLVLCCGQITIEGAMHHLTNNNMIAGPF